MEVDVEYPAKLRWCHNTLPFLPEKMNLDEVEKLVCNVFDKNKYVVHIRTLKQALGHGLNFGKIHQAISFKQSAWLEPYISFNTQLRKETKNDFEKDFFRLTNNSVFGKMMENVQQHNE